MVSVQQLKKRVKNLEKRGFVRRYVGPIHYVMYIHDGDRDPLSDGAIDWIIEEERKKQGYPKDTCFNVIIDEVRDELSITPIKHPLSGRVRCVGSKVLRLRGGYDSLPLYEWRDP